MKIFAVAIIAACIATPTVGLAADNWGCRNINFACSALDRCLDWPQADPNDKSRILDAAHGGNGRLAADGGFACAKNQKTHHINNAINDWNRDTKGCLDAGYAEAARRASKHDCTG